MSRALRTRTETPRAIRFEAGLSVRDLCQASGLAVRSVDMLEQGAPRSREDVRRYAGAVGVPVERLLNACGRRARKLDQALTLPQVAAILGKHPNAVRRLDSQKRPWWMRQPLLQEAAFVPPGGEQVRFIASEVYAYRRALTSRSAV